MTRSNGVFSKYNIEVMTEVRVKDVHGNPITSFITTARSVGGSFDTPLKEAIPMAVQDAAKKVGVLADALANGINKNEQEDSYLYD